MNPPAVPSRPSRSSFWTLVILAPMALALVGLLIWQGLKKPETSTTAGSPVLLQVTAAVVPGQEITLSLPGVASVRIPAGASDAEGSIVLAPREPDLFPEPDVASRWSRPIVVSVEFQDRDGNQVAMPSFAIPIEVCFSLNEAQWERYLADPAGHEVQYYDEGAGQWVRLPSSLHAGDRLVCGQAAHLTLMALAIRPLPNLGPTAEPTSAGPYSP